MAKRIFFSFDYEDVADFRANVVRNHWMTKKDREEAGFFDASIWETARKKGDESLKKLINEALENTTTTVILVGSDTYQRRWVRYEIVKSIYKGNGILGIHINSIKDKFQKTKAQGANPFDHIAITYNQDGTKLSLLEWNGQQWQTYKDFEGYKLTQQRPQHQWGKSYKLTEFYKIYDWETDKGYDNFSDWIGK